MSRMNELERHRRHEIPLVSKLKRTTSKGRKELDIHYDVDKDSMNMKKRRKSMRFCSGRGLVKRDII